jgi:hypothetical protein
MKIQVWLNLTRITDTLHEDQYRLMIIPILVLLKMRNVSEKSCRGNHNTHFTFKYFFWKSYLLWVNVEQYGTARQATDDNTIRRMRFACWMIKATDTHPKYAILIAFPQQQWICERTTMLHLYLYCLSCLFLTATCRSGTIQIECIFAFPLQQLLSERARIDPLSIVYK